VGPRRGIGIAAALVAAVGVVVVIDRSSADDESAAEVVAVETSTSTTVPTSVTVAPAEPTTTAAPAPTTTVVTTTTIAPPVPVCAAPYLPYQVREDFNIAYGDSLEGVEATYSLRYDQSAVGDHHPPAGVTFAREGVAVQAPVAIGDLDGDDHVDFVIAVESLPMGGDYYVVPGAVAPGVHDPADVGVHVLRTEQWGWFLPPTGVGDQDGDGRDDVFDQTGSVAHVLPGFAFLAPGPGGALEAWPAPVRVLPVDDYATGGPFFRGWVRQDGADEGAVPLLAEANGEEVVITIEGEVPIGLRTGPSFDDLPADRWGNASGYMATSGGGLDVVRRQGHRMLTMFAYNRSTMWIWDLDDPCRPVEAWSG
jgi:hypothetical protein